MRWPPQRKGRRASFQGVSGLGLLPELMWMIVNAFLPPSGLSQWIIDGSDKSGKSGLTVAKSVEFDAHQIHDRKEEAAGPSILIPLLEIVEDTPS